MKKLSTFLFSAAMLCGIVLAEEEVMHKTIISLEPSEMENVALDAVTEHPYMQVIAGDNPMAGSLNKFHSNDGEFEVDFYHGSEVTLKLADWPVHEVMYFVEGQVEITDESGAARIYGPGDALVMPKGFSGTWRQLSPIKKISVSYLLD